MSSDSMIIIMDLVTRITLLSHSPNYINLYHNDRHIGKILTENDFFVQNPRIGLKYIKMEPTMPKPFGLVDQAISNRK